jgi:hypothetical protein
VYGGETGARLILAASSALAKLATKVEADLNYIEGYIPPDDLDYRSLDDDTMAYVRAELRKRCQRARGIVWAEW